MKKNIKTLMLNVSIIIFTIIYVIGNIETILIYSYWNNKDNANHLWLKYRELLSSMFGREKGIDVFYAINGVSWWFVENHKNVIFFIIITIMMTISIIIEKKEKRLSKILLVYFIISFFIMAFIAFLASPRFADYYF